MNKQSYYEFFGLQNYETNTHTIKKAYRSMALKWHPDRNTDKVKAEEMMKQVNEVWRILSNASYKAQYDQHLKGKQGSTKWEWKYEPKEEPKKKESFYEKANSYNRYGNFKDIYEDLETVVREAQHRARENERARAEDERKRKERNAEREKKAKADPKMYGWYEEAEEITPEEYEDLNRKKYYHADWSSPETEEIIVEDRYNPRTGRYERVVRKRKKNYKTYSENLEEQRKRREWLDNLTNEEWNMAYTFISNYRNAKAEGRI